MHISLHILYFSTPSVSGRTFSEADAFIGYQSDTSAEVVFQATEMLRGWKLHSSFLPDHALGGLQPDEIKKASEESGTWKQAVCL